MDQNNNIVHSVFANFNKLSTQQLSDHFLKVPKKWDSEKVTEYDTVSIQQFLTLSNQYKQGFRDLNYVAGEKVIFLLPLSVELFALIWACISEGVVPVFLEPTLGLKMIRKSIQVSHARSVFSSRKLLLLSYLIPELWDKDFFAMDGSLGPIRSLNEFLKGNLQLSPPATRSGDDTALISFTSGTGGNPKAADRNHRILGAQFYLGYKYWPRTQNVVEVDMPFFPLLVSHNLGHGTSTVVPAIDFRKPWSMNPALVLNQINTLKVTRLSAAPYYLSKLSEYMLQNNIRNQQLKSLVAGGAALPVWMAKNIREVFPTCDCNVVYGATEAEPISHIKMEDYIAATEDGYCVGNPIEEINVKIDPVFGSNFKFGEILLHGPHVIERYLFNEKSNSEFKYQDNEGLIWHRTGDIGYLDTSGRIYLLGRKSEMLRQDDLVVSSFAIEKKCEGLIVDNTMIKRAAIVQRGYVKKFFLQVYDLKNFTSDLRLSADLKSSICKEVNKILETYLIEEVEIKFIKRIPVEKRHYWKVLREDLRERMF